MSMQYRVVRSKRKTLAIEVSIDGTVTVRCPFGCRDSQIAHFVEQQADWIEKAKMTQRQKALKRPPEPDEEQVIFLKNTARQYIPKRVEYFEELTGLKSASVKITSAKGRFGSCGPKNNLCFSYRLMLYPKAAIDYVIVHELCHTVHHNHSKEFWDLVEQVMPDYKKLRNLLK